MKTSTLLLLAGAGLLAAHTLSRPSPMGGDMMPGMGEMGGFGKKLKKGFKKATGGIKKVGGGIKQVAKTTAAVAQKYDPGTKLVTKAMQTTVKHMPKFVRKVPLSIGGKRISGGGSSGAPAPGQEVEYQDANGNVITAAQYAAMEACMAGGGEWVGGSCQRPQPQVQQPQPQQPQQPQQDWSQYLPAMPSSGGGGGGGGESLLPPSTSTPAPSVVDTAAPAKKSNPLLAIAAFVAVPVVMGMTGGK